MDSKTNCFEHCECGQEIATKLVSASATVFLRFPGFLIPGFPDCGLVSLRLLGEVDIKT